LSAEIAVIRQKNRHDKALLRLWQPYPPHSIDVERPMMWI